MMYGAHSYGQGYYGALFWVTFSDDALAVDYRFSIVATPRIYLHAATGRAHSITATGKTHRHGAHAKRYLAPASQKIYHIVMEVGNMNQWFSAKDPDEVIVLSIDTTPMLNPGETVTSQDWLISREDKEEDTTSMKSGTTDGSEKPVIKQKIQAGAHNGTYIHRVKIVTSEGRTLIHGVRQLVSFGA